MHVSDGFSKNRVWGLWGELYPFFWGKNKLCKAPYLGSNMMYPLHVSVMSFQKQFKIKHDKCVLSSGK